MGVSAVELRRQYEALRDAGFPLGESMDFGAELGRSGELALHFELVLEDGRRPRPQRWHPEDYFRFHRQAGVDFLRGLLKSGSRDEETLVCGAYLLAELLPRGRYAGQEEITRELNRALTRFAESETPEHRRKALIALGWVGSEGELPVLERHLLSDGDPLCRAWSASAYLQMSGRLPAGALRAGCSGPLLLCLERETDVFVRGVAVETVQTVWDVKLGIRGSAVENRNRRAVNRAAGRAMAFLRAELSGREERGEAEQ